MHLLRSLKSSSSSPKSKFIKRSLLVLCFFAAIAIGAVIFAKPLLLIEDKPIKADAIVVLGGESGDRTFRAFEIFKSGAAPIIVVSGTGDCYLIRNRLLLAGVPENKVFIEENSKNTKENAEFSVKLLQNHRVKEVIIVTSWYHSRRALACFKHFGKDMEFFSMPAYHGLNMDHKPCVAETTYVFHEYLGLAWYLVSNRISPL